MLPFLAKNRQAQQSGVIVKQRQPDENTSESDQDDSSAGKEACGQAIIDAIKSGNGKAVADAMQDMYDMCQDSGSEPEPHSYDAQNQLAGEE